MRCPHCKNTDPAYFEDNGLRKTDPSFTLLCLAPVKKGDEANSDGIRHDNPEDARFVGVCGMQWEPNDEDEDDEE